MLARLRDFLGDETGATAVEYGVLAAMVALGIVAAVTVLGGHISNMFNTVSTEAAAVM